MQIVLLPYEITLLSNNMALSAAGKAVLLPYEITLLSNAWADISQPSAFYYLMKLHYSQTTQTAHGLPISFTTL